MNDLKFGGVPLSLELTAKEADALQQIAHGDKRGVKEQVRWLIEEYWKGALRHFDDGTRTREYLSPTENHYPDGIRLRTPPTTSE